MGFADKDGYVRILKVVLAPLLLQLLLKLRGSQASRLDMWQKLDGDGPVIFYPNNLPHLRKIEDFDHQHVFRTEDVVGAKQSARNFITVVASCGWCGADLLLVRVRTGHCFGVRRRRCLRRQNPDAKDSPHQEECNTQEHSSINVH